MKPKPDPLSVYEHAVIAGDQPLARAIARRLFPWTRGAPTVREHARCRGNIESLCRVFDSSKAAMERRIAGLFGQPA